MKSVARDKLIQKFGLPPQNLEAEESLLCALLLDNDEMSAVREILEPEDFYSTAHTKIFAAMIELTNQEKPIDLVTLTNCLKTRDQLEKIGGAVYLARLVDTVPIAVNNVLHYAEIVKEKAIKRMIIERMNVLIKEAFDDTTELDELLAKAMETFSIITQKAAKGDGAQKLEITADNLQNHFYSLTETPFKSLNNEIEGLAVGELTIIGGRPGMGKTALALEFLSHTAINEGTPVIYCGAQTTMERIYARLLAQRCKVSLRKILGSRVPKDKQKLLLQNHMQINNSSIRTIIIKDRISVPDLQTQVMSARDRIKEDIGLLIIENLQQLYWPGKSFRNEWEQASFICEKLKPLNYEIGAPLVVSSQLNRDVEDRKDRHPLPSDILGKKGEELSDVIIFPYRPNYYAKDRIKEEGRPEKDAEILISKGGPPVTLPFIFWGDYLSWEEI